jgi:hypothetical protein
MNGILGRKVVLYACRSIERHLQIAFFACRSIERHAKMAIVTCRSMERHLKMGMLACRSIGRHLKAWIRYRRPSLVAGTLAWIRYRRPSLVAGTLAWIRYRRPSLVAGKNMYKKVGNLKTYVDRYGEFHPSKFPSIWPTPPRTNHPCCHMCVAAILTNVSTRNDRLDDVRIPRRGLSI